MKQFVCDFKLNSEWLRRQFENSATFQARKVVNVHQPELPIMIFYFDCMVNGDRLNRDVVAALCRQQLCQGEGDLAERVANSVLYAGTRTFSDETETAAVQIASGDCVVMVGDCPRVIILDLKGFATRSVEQPDGEISIAGPHEGFNENIINALGLIKKRLCSPKLRAEFIKLGKQSHTAVGILYMEGIVKEGVVRRVREQVKRISIDGVWDANYVSEMLLGNTTMLFPLVGKTQRPDVAAAKLCEGRVILLINGSPTALSVPYVFTENFQTSDDYYTVRPYGNVGRILRMVGFFLSFLVPGIFIALVLHHPQMLPGELMYSLAAAGRGVPIGSLPEILLITLVFEILRETGARMPSAIGLALNVVGALVLGQAAVEAGFVSAPMVIVVAFSGTVGLMVGGLRGTVFFLRLGFIAAGALLGWFGILALGACLWVYLHSLNSCGVPYMYTFSPFYSLAEQDVFFRAKIPFMNFRNKKFSENRKRQGRV